MNGERFLLIVAMLLLVSPSLLGCALVDERQDDCPEEITLTCSINVVNNEEQEMDELLGTPHDRPLREALEDYLTNVFATTSHEVELFFYDQRSRGKMTSRLRKSPTASPCAASGAPSGASVGREGEP